MLIPASASGLRMAARTPTAENSSLPTTVNARQPGSHDSDAGTAPAGQIIDSSCAVRVTDTRGSAEKLNHEGMAASGGRRKIANSPSSSLRTRSSPGSNRTTSGERRAPEWASQVYPRDFRPHSRFLVLPPVAPLAASGRLVAEQEREHAALPGTNRQQSSNCRNDDWRVRARS